MSAELRDSRRIASAWLLSLVGHLALVSGGAVIFARSLSDPADRLARPPPADDKIEIELPTMVEGSVAAGAAPVATPELLPRGGGEALPRPDSGSAGRGGTDTAAQPAYNLADRDDGAFLSSEVMSRLDRSQIARIETGAGDRASREDWRASRRPMELTFLASGSPDGKRAERRTPSKTDPSAGSEGAGVAAHRGSAPGAAERPEGVGEPTRAPGAAELGGDRSSPGSGVRDGRAGLDHRDSADVARGRPRVAEGTPSVPANVADKPRDTLDSEQEVASAIQSIVHASTAGGAPRGGGGGAGGAGAAPAGGGGGGGPPPPPPGRPGRGAPPAPGGAGRRARARPAREASRARARARGRWGRGRGAGPTTRRTIRAAPTTCGASSPRSTRSGRTRSRAGPRSKGSRGP